MKILIATIDRHHYANRMDTNHAQVMDKLASDNRFCVTTDPRNIDNLNDYSILVNDHWPHFNREIVPNFNGYFGKFIQDYYSWQLANQMGLFPDVDFLVLRYKTPITLGDMFAPKVRVGVSHHFDLNIYKDYKLPKTIDVLFYGKIDAELYPFRYRVYSILKKFRRTKVSFIPHPGYNEVDDDKIIRLDKLSKRINSAWLTVSVPMNHLKQQDDFLQKFGEIALSNSCLLGYPPEEVAHLFGENYVRITPTMTDKQIRHTIVQALRNKQQLADKAKALQDVFVKNFDINTYPDKFYEACKWAIDQIQR